MFNKTGFPAAATFLTIFLAVISRVASAGSAVLELPSPNGCYPIGTTTFLLRDGHRNRDLLVTIWYPAAAASSIVAPYMDRQTAAAVAEEWNLERDFQLLVHTHGVPQAPLLEGARFPVVLLEHGSNTVPALYTVLAEGLASSGFIVAATNHPPDSLIAVFPDGHELKFTPYWPAEADRRTQGLAIGRFADQVLVADVQFVLDQLTEMNSHDRFWAQHLDLSKIGIVGHSMGGTTAALATQKDSRILAGANLDGSTYPGMNADIRPVPVHKPLLFLATEEHASSETGAREFVGSESNTYYVVLHGADHMSFTDVRLLTSRFGRDSKAAGKTYEDALLRLELTRSLVEEFLSKHLKGASAPHLDITAQIDKR